MAAPMWRMNGLWRRMAGVLVLCALLLSNEVMCQDDAATDATDAPAADSISDASAVTDAATAAPDTPAAPDAVPDPTNAPVDDSVSSAAPGHIAIPATLINFLAGLDDQDGGDSGTSGTTASPNIERKLVPAVEVTDDSHVVKAVVPAVECVGEGEISDSNAIVAEMQTTDCEETKRIIQENPAGWCHKENCLLKIFQDAKKVMVSSEDAKLESLSDVLGNEPLKSKLGLTSIEVPSSSSSGSSVFVGILVSGLLAALAIIVGYFKCQRRPDTKGVRLAEEAYPADQENQGNTLVSVAPLNPPPETQEKPSVNGESPEAAKTQPPPPTNGHSTAKTADTEL